MAFTNPSVKKEFSSEQLTSYSGFNVTSDFINHCGICCKLDEPLLESASKPFIARGSREHASGGCQKNVYHSDAKAMGKCIASFVQLIYRVSARLKADENCLFHLVFHEQYTVESRVAIPREKKEINAKSVQNPNDPDADYCKKGDQQIKGYCCNITETTDEKEKPGLIPDVQVKPATAADNSYLVDAVLYSEQMSISMVERVYADGAYQIDDNRTFALENDNELFIADIQELLSRFELERQESSLIVTDRQTGEVITAQNTKNGKYRIRSPSGIEISTVISRMIKLKYQHSDGNLLTSP